MNGGYINIDASGLDIHKTTKQTITGLYKQLYHATKVNKPIFVCNTFSGEYGKISPIIVFCYTAQNENIFCMSTTMEILVDKNDGVIVRKADS
jgi:hypothetical protein